MPMHLGDRGEALEEREESAVVMRHRSPQVQFSVCVFGV